MNLLMICLAGCSMPHDMNVQRQIAHHETFRLQAEVDELELERSDLLSLEMFWALPDPRLAEQIDLRAEELEEAAGFLRREQLMWLPWSDP